jgi:hypothetical protein
LFKFGEQKKITTFSSWWRHISPCSGVKFGALTYVSFSSAQPQQGIGKSHHIATICGVTVGSVAFIAFVVGILLWWRHRRNQQIFFDVNGNVLFYSVPV